MIYYLELLVNIERCLFLAYKNKKKFVMEKALFFTFFQKSVFNTYNFG